MGAVMSQFTFLPDLRFYDVEVYKLWSVDEGKLRDEEAGAVLDSDKDEFRRLEEEAAGIDKEHRKLAEKAERARTMGNLMEKDANVAINSATASMRSAIKGLSSKKVHPS